MEKGADQVVGAFLCGVVWITQGRFQTAPAVMPFHVVI